MRLKDPAYLAAKRIEAGLTQREAAGLYGVTQQFVSLMENAQRTTMTPRVAAKIARTLRVPLEDLFAPEMVASVAAGSTSSAGSRRASVA